MGRTRGTGDVADVGRWIAAALLACVVAAGFLGRAATQEAAMRAAASHGSIVVTVRAFDRKPVAGARVIALRPPRESASLWPGTGDASLPRWLRTPAGWDQTPVASAVTDAEGRAVLVPVPDGRWLVRAEAPGRVVRSASVGVRRTETAVELLVEPARTVTGRVVGPGGAALGGYLVAATYPALLGDWPTFASDTELVVKQAGPDGTFRLDGLPHDRVSFTCGTRDAWSDRTSGTSDPHEAEVELKVALGPPLCGVVSDDLGRPVAAADVTVLSADFDAPYVVSHGTTDADGRFEIRDHAAQRIRSIDVTAAGFSGPARFEAPAEGSTECRVVLFRTNPSPPSVRLRFVGPAGPVAGVTAWLVGTRVNGYFRAASASDEDGSIEFYDVPRGEVRVSLEDGAGHALACDAAAFEARGEERDDDEEPVVPEELLLWIEGDETVVQELRMVPGARISGRVVAPDGRPVGGAVVRAGSVQTVADDEGRFRFAGLGQVGTLHLSADDAVRAASGSSAPVVAAPGREAARVVIRLKPKSPRDGVTVSGRVVVGVARTPAVGASLRLNAGCAVTDAQGRLRAVLRYTFGEDDARITFDGCEDHPVELPRGISSGTIDLGEIVLARTGERSDLALRGSKQARVACVVRVFDSTDDDDGDVVPGAQISVAHEGHEDWRPAAGAVSGADGRVVVGPLPAGRWKLRAAAPQMIGMEEFVLLTDDMSEPVEADLSLYRVTPLRVRVVDTAGAPVRDALVSASEESTMLWRSGWTDAEGRAELAVRTGAELSLGIASHPEQGGARFLGTRMAPFVPGADEVAIVVSRGATIAGRLLTADGAPVGGAEVVAKLQAADGFAGAEDEYRTDERSATSAPDGSFVIDGCSPGTYRLGARSGVLRSAAITVSSGTHDAMLRFPPTEIIEGMAVAADGRPARGMQIGIVDLEDCEAKDATLTDRNGVFLFQVPAGRTYAMSERDRIRGVPPVVGGWARTRWLRGGAEVSSGAGSVVLRVPGTRDLSVSLQLRRPGGKPAEGVLWHAHASLEKRLSGRTSESGEIAFDTVMSSREVPVSVVAGGIVWEFGAPCGSHGTVITLDDSGVLAARDGDREVEAATAWVRVARGPGDAAGDPQDVRGLLENDTVRLVHTRTGEAAERTASDAEDAADKSVPFDAGSGKATLLRFRRLPIGRYRVEVRTTEDGPWREAKPVVARSGMPWFRIDSE